MDLFGRYFFRQLAGSFLIILVTLTTVIWLASTLTKLDLLTTHGQTLVTMLKMTTLAVPALLEVIAPISLLVACLYTFDRLNGDSEVIVMSAAGAPVWRFAAPCLLLAGIVSACMLVLTLLITPASMRMLRSYVDQVRADLISQVLLPGRFSSPEKGLTFHIRDRSPNGELIGLFVHDGRSPKQAMTYLANKGLILKNEDGAYLVMKDGQVHRLEQSKGNKEVNIVEFDQYIFDITQYGSKAEDSALRANELYVTELLNPDPANEHYKRRPRLYVKELHDRFSASIYPLTFILIVVCCLGQPRTVRESRWTAVVIAFGLALLLRALGLTATNALTKSQAAIYLVYGIPVGAIIVAAFVAHVTMGPYARFRINLDALAKLQILNEKILTVLGVKTEQNGGRVG